MQPIAIVDAAFFRSPGFYVRVSLLGAVAVAMFAVLGFRLWSLEVVQGPRFAAAAGRQAFRIVDFPTTRAPVVDRNGRMLVSSAGDVALAVDARELGRIDAHGRWQPSLRGWLLLGRVARLTGVRRGVLMRRVRRGVVRSPYAPAVIVPRVRPLLSFYFDERATAFPGVHVVVLPDRRYPEGALGSEFLGLLGQISPPELKQRLYRGYRPGEIVGQSGIERTYDRLLNGGLAPARVAVDAQGRPVGPLRLLRHPRPLRILQLTIDTRLQRAAEQAIRDGIAFAHQAGHTDADAGAAVVMNPNDGSVYALASYPDFDQRKAATNPHYLAQLLDSRNPSRPLLDRATQGLYATGSTFKPIAAEAALATGMITRDSILQCTGSLTVGNHVFHNVEPSINAPMDLEEALSASCDTWFYRLGTEFYWRQVDQGDPAMQRWAMRLGLGHTTGIDVPGEAGGVVPTPAWLRRTFRTPWQRIWYEGYSVNLAIGQGALAVTPLQLAVAYSALANGGTVVRPHVTRAVLSPDGRTIRTLRFRPRAHVRLTDVAAIRDGLYQAAHFGTSAAVFGSFRIPVAGKTGTAQAPYGSDHSWYASWAPAYDPKVVVVVVIEHGGFGAEAAAPATREIYSSFFR